MTGAQLSVLITTFNNAPQIRELLENVKWADQILIVDSFSTDATVDICREYTDDVLQHEYIGPARQKNWAIPQCRHEWVLIVDTDERIPRGLREEILSILSGPIDGEVDAYRVARKTLFLGKWVREMLLWPDYQTRLFRRSRGRYEEKEVHEHLLVPGVVLTLRSPLIHNATPTLSKQIAVLDRYSRYQANELAKQGRRFRWTDLALRPVAVFLYLYLLKSGWRAGFRGLFVSFLQAAFSFFTYSKLWEKEWRAGLRP